MTIRWRTAGAVALATTLLAGMIAPAFAATRPAPSAPAPAPARIVGGQLAPNGAAPWVVRLSMGCAGSLVAKRVVLTAGHCVGPTGRTTGIGVIAGTNDLQSRTALRARSVSVYRAPGFRAEIYGDDWALIKLDRSLRLPLLPVTPGSGYDKGTFTVVGWGQVSEQNPTQQRYLRAAAVPFVSDRPCARAYRSLNYPFVSAEMLCAGDLARGGVDSCYGDSGGPLLRRDGKGRWLQVGIVSWGHGCARRGYPGVYTQLSTFRGAVAKAVRALS